MFSDLDNQYLVWIILLTSKYNTDALIGKLVNLNYKVMSASDKGSVTVDTVFSISISTKNDIEKVFNDIVAVTTILDIKFHSLIVMPSIFSLKSSPDRAMWCGSNFSLKEKDSK